MLPGKQRGRRNNGHLIASHCGGEGRAHGHLGLAKADIAADEPVHGLAACQILEHLGNDTLLILCFSIRKAVHKCRIRRRFQFHGHTRAKRSLGCGTDQLMRDPGDAFLQLRLASLPGLTPQFVQGDCAVM